MSKNLHTLPAKHPLKPRALKVDSIGITNGCVDFGTAFAGYPQYAYNNTYGVRFGSKALYEAAMHNLTKPDGCIDLVNQCRALGQAKDPAYNGGNPTVNKLCMEALGYCELYVLSSFPKLSEASIITLFQVPGRANVG